MAQIEDEDEARGGEDEKEDEDEKEKELTTSTINYVAMYMKGEIPGVLALKRSRGRRDACPTLGRGWVAENR